ncbi:MAG: hypothetical protein RIT81_22025 [Deltaproteobacteria bacterium]
MKVRDFALIVGLIGPISSCIPMHRCDCCDRIVVQCPGSGPAGSAGTGLDPVDPNDPCPPCTLYISDTQLQGVLDPKYSKHEYPFTTATLTVFNAAANPIGQAILQPDHQYGGTNIDQKVVFDTPLDTNDIKSASIRWVDKNGAVVEQPNIMLKP